MSSQLWEDGISFQANIPRTDWLQFRKQRKNDGKWGWWGRQGPDFRVFCTSIKRCLLLGRKAMTNIDSILKSRDITLPTKVQIIKAIVFPIVMYGCESWIIRKVECGRTNALKLWCWGRLLRVPWIARRSNQSIPKEINPEYSLEGLMLKLKLQYFGTLMWRADSFEKTDAEKDWS